MKHLYKLMALFFLIGCTAAHTYSDSTVPEKEIFSRDAYEARYSCKRAVFILPGLRDSPYGDEYHTVASLYYENGFLPVFITIDWNNFTLVKIDRAAFFVSEVLSLYPEYEIHIFGFSIGAVIALLAAENGEYDSIVLSSMSPVFYEDVRLRPRFIQFLIRLLSGNVYRKYSYPELECQNIFFLYGEYDSAVFSEDIIYNRNNIYPQSSSHIIPDTGHSLKGENYRKTLTAIIEGL